MSDLCDTSKKGKNQQNVQIFGCYGQNNKKIKMGEKNVTFFYPCFSQITSIFHKWLARVV